ncbi:flagellar biosynthesis protein FlgI [Pseudodonghicola flavimaris]|uniref:Flagellar biosynthesis protein FlgI n=1 Tax=Pseudodonghicola flavimaris TaxID=3050036 RepID=A0ABT7EWK3_9RHOB|nr:flagellar biosynthesis protein FlgI [Pseudodonghicola flavimaris]MDK3016716.1 flagellar biosynthesis protein FlgI [Pseudodonghicola flavimaris]
MREGRKFRIGRRQEARRSQADGAGPVLTEEDEANIDAFSAKVGEAVSLLNEEIAAIRAGRLQIVGELFDRKAALLKWLELRMPLIEPFLRHEAVRARGLPVQLAQLQKAVSEDSALLQRMARAAGTIVRELKKASERNGLSGLYGKSGQKIGNSTGGRLRIDREF